MFTLYLSELVILYPISQQLIVNYAALKKEAGRIAINSDRFYKLITALRTAVANDGTLDKEATSYNDIFDAFRQALKFYHFEDSSSE